jgi:hypothetical protein
MGKSSVETVADDLNPFADNGAMTLTPIAVSDDDKARHVLQVLNVKDIEQSMSLLNQEPEVKKHLCHLYDILELYQENGYFAEMQSASKRTQKRQAQHALDLFHLMNNVDSQKVVHAHKRKRNRLYYASSLFFFLLHTTGFVLSVLAASNVVDVSLPNDSMSTHSPIGMGYINAIGGLVQAFIELKTGNYAMAAGLALSNSQLLICTIIAHATFNAGLIGAYAAGGMMAGSISLMMVAATVWEYKEARKCKKRIKLLEEKLKSLSGDEKTIKEKRIHLEHALVVERARRDNHLRHAKSWQYCSIAMLAITAITFAALGALSFGALPAVTAAIGMIAIATTVIRKYVVNKIDHVEQAKLAKEKSLVNRLLDFEKEELEFEHNGQTVRLNLGTTINVSNGCLGMFAKQMTIKQYLTEMMHKDANKAESILNAISSKSLSALKNHLTSHDLWKEGAKIGAKIVEQHLGGGDAPVFGGGDEPSGSDFVTAPWDLAHS